MAEAKRTAMTCFRAFLVSLLFLSVAFAKAGPAGQSDQPVLHAPVDRGAQLDPEAEQYHSSAPFLSHRVPVTPRCALPARALVEAQQLGDLRTPTA